MGLYDDNPSYVPSTEPHVCAGNGFRLTVPSGWGVEQDDIGDRLVARPAPGVTCVELVTKVFGYALTLERHAAIHLEELRAAIPGVHIDERAFTRLAGQDAYRVDFTFERGGEALRAWRVLFVERNVAYRITYVAPRPRFDDHDATARELMASLELVR